MKILTEKEAALRDELAAAKAAHQQQPTVESRAEVRRLNQAVTAERLEALPGAVDALRAELATRRAPPRRKVEARRALVALQEEARQHGFALRAAP